VLAASTEEMKEESERQRVQLVGAGAGAVWKKPFPIVIAGVPGSEKGRVLRHLKEKASASGPHPLCFVNIKAKKPGSEIQEEREREREAEAGTGTGTEGVLQTGVHTRAHTLLASFVGDVLPPELEEYFQDYGEARKVIGAETNGTWRESSSPLPSVYVRTRELDKRILKEAQSMRKLGFVPPWFLQPLARDGMGRIVLTDGLSRCSKAEPMLLTNVRFQQAVKELKMIPLPSPSRTHNKGGNVEVFGVRSACIAALCSQGVAPVLHLDARGCVVVREAFGDALAVCYLVSQMHYIFAACKNKVLTPDVNELLHLCKIGEVFDEVVLSQSTSAAVDRFSKALHKAHARAFKTGMRYHIGKQNPFWDAQKGLFTPDASKPEDRMPAICK
jgi:hypothetical protein